MRFDEEPKLSEAEQIIVICVIMDSLAEDPYIVSMHGVEDLHADTKQTMSRCMHKRKKIQASIVAAQGLSRWKVLHGRFLGKHLATKKRMSVKSKIKEKPVLRIRTKPRKRDGHKVFTAEMNAHSVRAARILRIISTIWRRFTRRGAK